jgi:TonB family protein
MTREPLPTRSLRAFLAYCFGRGRAATAAQVARSEGRALQRLRQEPMWTSETPLFDTLLFSAGPARARTFSTAAVCAITAAACVAVIVAGLLVRTLAVRRSLVAVVEAGEGALSVSSDGRPRSAHTNEGIKFGDIVRSNGGTGGMLRLADGSHVEVRSHSELYLEHAEDGVRIRLNQGGIIVNAAKQHEGHLYVQTKDFVVSVVGTVFLVSAEDVGSRVAVLEGEVRVQRNGSDEKLRPGQQVTTSALPASPTLPEEIAWSRNAPSHLALLEQSAPTSTGRSGQSSATAEPRSAFVDSQALGQPPPVASVRQSRFVQVNNISIDAIVRDASGQPVVDLRKEDFKAFENDVEQTVETLSLERSGPTPFYLLSYRATSGAPPGRFRKIEIRVDRPGVRVQSRSGYYPSDPFSRGTYAEDEPDLVLPVVRERREPSYPAEGISRRIQGNVVIEAVVDVDGRVSRSRVMTALDKNTFGFDDEALNALTQWTFTPGELRGQKVPVLMQFVVTFRMR